jgi:hypothetical protein
LNSFDFPVISAIICNSSLKIKNEDSLFDFVKSGLDVNVEFSTLLGEIRYEYLSSSKVSDFLDIISSQFKYLTHSVWLSLRCRLLLPVQPESLNDRVYGHRLVPSGSGCLNGIISCLTRQFGGNVHDQNIVRVTANGIRDSTYHGKYAVDLEGNSGFCSDRSSNSWLCYDFKGMAIKPTQYTIRSYYNWGTGDWHPKNWVIEGSRDGSTWIELDRRENNNDLNGPNIHRTFSVSPSSGVRIIRLRQIGLNHASSNHIALSTFEVFGLLMKE